MDGLLCRKPHVLRQRVVGTKQRQVSKDRNVFVVFADTRPVVGASVCLQHVKHNTTHHNTPHTHTKHTQITPSECTYRRNDKR